MIKKKKNYKFFKKKKNTTTKNSNHLILKKIGIPNYLYTNNNLKQGIFLKKPTFNNIIYPFPLNFKLINEFLKKK